MQRTLIHNAAVITADTILRGHCLLIENGKIAQLAPDIKDVSDVSSCQFVDGAGHYLCPGFIDLHFHGIHTYSVDDGPESLAQICRILPRYGVTGFLPTVCPQPKGKDAEVLNALASCRSDGAQILGFHLEGPFLSLTGCLPPEALGDADFDRVNRLIDAAKPYKAIFSVSPEFENITELLPAMTAANTPAFLTHTKAGVSQTLEAITAGACHATHFYDVFYSPDISEPGVRPCGAVEAILASPEVSVDFILDGVHVDPVAVKMALQCKDHSKVCLCTDANIGAAMGPGRYRFGGYEVIISEQGSPARTADSNVLAGSGLTMNRAVKNAIEMLDIDLNLAVRMAGTNPAKVLRVSHKGEIKTGYDADLVLMDKSCTVLKTWVNGKCCYGD